MKMKKLLSILLVLCLMLGMIPCEALAATKDDIVWAEFHAVAGETVTIDDCVVYKYDWNMFGKTYFTVQVDEPGELIIDGHWGALFETDGCYIRDDSDSYWIFLGHEEAGLGSYGISECVYQVEEPGTYIFCWDYTMPPDTISVSVTLRTDEGNDDSEYSIKLVAADQDIDNVPVGEYINLDFMLYKNGEPVAAGDPYYDQGYLLDYNDLSDPAAFDAVWYWGEDADGNDSLSAVFPICDEEGNVIGCTTRLVAQNAGSGVLTVTETNTGISMEVTLTAYQKGYSLNIQSNNTSYSAYSAGLGDQLILSFELLLDGEQVEFNDVHYSFSFDDESIYAYGGEGSLDYVDGAPEGWRNWHTYVFDALARGSTTMTVTVYLMDLTAEGYWTEILSEQLELSVYPIIVGTVNTTGKVYFGYDENAFSESSYTYNHGLAQAASGLSLMAYSTKSKIKDVVVNQMGFEGFYTWNDDFQDTTGLYSPFAIAHKKITLDGEETEIILVIIRGTYKMEWLDNFDTGTGTVHEGFQRASDYVLKGLNSYISSSEYGVDTTANFKILVTGHSRGAAVANLLGKALDDGELSGVSYAAEDVFVYTFATPNTTRSSSRTSGTYNNIFNIVNPEDFVTKVVPSDWGYGRYGITYVLPSKTTETAGKENYVDYSEYLAELRVWSDKTNPDDKYQPYPDGMDNLAYYVKNVTTTVTSILEYNNKSLYDCQFWWPGTKSNTLHNLYKYGLGGLVSGNLLSEAKAILVINDASGNGYGAIGSKTVSFFIKNAGWNSYFACAHTAETYYAAMKTLTSEELQQNRKTVKGIVNCPVDITVTDEDGTVVGRIVDNTVDETVEDGITMVVDGDSKIFYLPDGAEYTVTLTGNADGEMDYSLCEVDPDTGEISRVYYEDVPVEEGVSMTQTISAGSQPEESSLLDTEQNVIAPTAVMDTDSLGSLSVEVTVEGVGGAESRYNLTEGDYVTLTAYTDENNEFLGWYDEDGNLVAEEEEYSFSIHQSMKFTAKFTDVTVDVTDIELEYDSVSLDVGEYVVNTVSVVPSNATNKSISYSSADSSVATVDEFGIIYGVSAGSTVITVTAANGAIVKTFTVNVGDGADDDDSGSNTSGDDVDDGSDSGDDNTGSDTSGDDNTGSVTSDNNTDSDDGSGSATDSVSSAAGVDTSDSSMLGPWMAALLISGFVIAELVRRRNRRHSYK